MTQSLFELEQKPISSAVISARVRKKWALLATVGAESLDDLIEQTVPAAIRRPGPLGIGAPMTEVEALAKLKGYAAKNQIAKSYIGMGYHDTHVPHVILRNVLENPGWYTAYTPISPSWPRAVSKPCSTSSSSPWISPAWIWRAPPAR